MRVCLLLASLLALGDVGVGCPQAASNPCVALADPADSNLAYNQQLGICLYSKRSKQTHSDAESLCSSSRLLKKAGVARLVRANSPTKRESFFSFLLSLSIGYKRIWTEAACNETMSKFYWSNGEPVSLNCSTRHQRVYLEVPEWSTSPSDLLVDPTGNLTLIPVCEYDVPRCDPSAVAGYSNSSMSLNTSPFVNKTVRFNCAPGYYRESEVVQIVTSSFSWATAAAIAERHRYLCQFCPSENQEKNGSASFIPVGSSLPLESCLPIACDGQQLLKAPQIPDAEESYKFSVNATRKYRFGDSIEVHCKKGYVSYNDTTNTNTSVTCGQSELDPSLGWWMPPSLALCSPVKCKSAMPFFDSNTMEAYKAYDRSKDRSYSSGESNRFPFYPNVVSLRCREAGYFFMDRKYDKSLQCSLPSNGSRTIGVWVPVDGTVLSNDIMRCKKITCLTNEIVIPIQQADLPAALAEANLNDTVTVTDATGLSSNISIREFTQAFDMAYNTRVRVYCQYTFDMSVTSSDTGRIEMVSSFEVSCAPSGTWSAKITSCIKVTDSIVTSGTKKFIPPPKEAESAKSLGLVVILILVLFFSIIIILDLTTITRDIRLMRRNLKRIRVRWRH